MGRQQAYPISGKASRTWANLQNHRDGEQCALWHEWEERQRIENEPQRGECGIGARRALVTGRDAMVMRTVPGMRQLRRAMYSAIHYSLR